MLRSKAMVGTVFQPVTTENLPGQPSIFSFFTEAGIADRVVLAILLLFSFVSWVIIFAKFIPLTTLFKAGYAELDAQVKANRAEDSPTTGGGAAGKLLIKNISGIERALER